MFAVANGQAQVATVTEKFENIDEYPRYPGCNDPNKPIEELEECSEVRLMQFIYSNLKYPDVAKSKKLTGNVTVKFTVEKDGKITNAKIDKGLGDGCDEEVMRLVQMMPAWVPGKHEGKTLDVDFILSVKFTL